MSWWGKVVGGTFGFMLAGPLGALMGAAVGNYFDGGVVSAGGRLGLGETERVQSAFFTTTFALMGYVAKSDGRVTRDEIAVAERVMDQMRLNATQRKVAIKLFEQGKADDFPAQAILAQFRRESFRRSSLVQMLLEIVAATALADGVLHAQERATLEEVAAALGVSASRLDALLTRVSGQAGFEDADASGEKLKAAYALLALKDTADMSEVKRAYRRQMSQHHPDKLVAKGLPEEMIDIATRKTQAIKSAYDLIRKARA
ncbi:MAG: co-chaperone DjlA [Gammaproteobacteria bacterium]|jgi:DnaJ like chaperone protein|nr:co-chaperone DjlA [Gammaproteobacteria bacterium]